jgi:adenosylcobinamide-GDP ribazoletransferase
MRDSRIGTYGVLALILSVGLRWAALVAVLFLSPWLLVALGALSRLPMVWLMALLPPARPGGLSATVGRPPHATVWLATAVALLLALPWIWTAPLALLPLMAIATIATGWLARARIGGQTGDILGASQQVAEIVGLLVLCARA